MNKLSWIWYGSGGARGNVGGVFWHLVLLPVYVSLLVPPGHPLLSVEGRSS